MTWKNCRTLIPLEDGPPDVSPNSLCFGFPFELWGFGEVWGIFPGALWAKSLNVGIFILCWRMREDVFIQLFLNKGVGLLAILS